MHQLLVCKPCDKTSTTQLYLLSPLVHVSLWCHFYTMESSLAAVDDLVASTTTNNGIYSVRKTQTYATQTYATQNLVSRCIVCQAFQSLS